MSHDSTPPAADRRISQPLRARFEAAVMADLERVLWMEEALLPPGDREGAVREALQRAYRVLSRFHAG
ncbi:MAG: hypothetical protein ACF8XB_24930 [Planctomycetota bacterium JB042]